MCGFAWWLAINVLFMLKIKNCLHPLAKFPVLPNNKSFLYHFPKLKQKVGHFPDPLWKGKIRAYHVHWLFLLPLMCLIFLIIFLRFCLWTAGVVHAKCRVFPFHFVYQHQCLSFRFELAILAYFSWFLPQIVKKKEFILSVAYHVHFSVAVFLLLSCLKF